MSIAAPIVLRPGDESKLRTVLRCSTAGAGVAQRARIVLLAAEGVSNAEIGRRVGVSRPTVLSWRGRYEQLGIAGLGDLDRSGRPPVIDDLAVVVATLAAPPESLGVTHWSARLLGKHPEGLVGITRLSADPPAAAAAEPPMDARPIPLDSIPQEGPPPLLTTRSPKNAKPHRLR